MSTTDIGKQAEQFVSEYLTDHGYTVTAQNWRTRWCEIDVIATKNNTVYFIEVKYRKSAAWGDGLDAITYKKQTQMQFAAELWLNSSHWQGKSCLVVYSVLGMPLTINQIVEI